MENPNFYVIIPANVRYADIMPNAKLLYWEITALANKTGCCFATNWYFAKLYWVDQRQVSRWFLDLINNNFIEVIIKKSEGNKREIYIDKNVDTYRQKSLYLPTKKSIPIDEKVLSYNKMNNTINNTIIIAEEEKEIFENNIIESLDEFRLFLNKWKLQETFYYKIGDNDSFERTTTDFFLYMEEKGKKINKKTAEARFISFLKPKWETDEDRQELIKIYKRKINKIKAKHNIIDESEEEEKEIDLKNKRFIEIESKLSEEKKRQYRQEAENKINTLTKWHWNKLSSFGLLIQSKYKQIILDNEDK